MATLNNPFVVYGYKGAEYFCDRQKETEKMISTLHNERNITLVAPRPWGRGDDPFLYPVLAECVFRVFGQSAAHDSGVDRGAGDGLSELLCLAYGEPADAAVGDS